MAKGLTQEQLAERTELSTDCIRRIEHGRWYPSLSTLRKLCTGFEINLSTLFEGYEKKHERKELCRSMKLDINTVDDGENLDLWIRAGLKLDQAMERLARYVGREQAERASRYYLVEKDTYRVFVDYCRGKEGPSRKFTTLISLPHDEPIELVDELAADRLGLHLQYEGMAGFEVVDTHSVLVEDEATTGDPEKRSRP